jgi:hypothetical protein
VRSHGLYSGFTDQQTVSQSEKCLFCHSEFISESHVFSMLQAIEILKRVQDDNCDTVCKSGNDKNMSFPQSLSGNPVSL